MTVGLRVDELEELLVARVDGIDATPFDQRVSNSALEAPAWRESEVPLSVTSSVEGRSLGHLRFNVFAERAVPVSDRQRPGEATKTRSRVTVVFTYKIRPVSQLADQRLAARAANAVAKAIKALPQNQYTAQLVDGWLPSVQPDGEWMRIAVVFNIFFEMPV